MLPPKYSYIVNIFELPSRELELKWLTLQCLAIFTYIIHWILKSVFIGRYRCQLRTYTRLSSYKKKLFCRYFFLLVLYASPHVRESEFREFSHTETGTFLSIALLKSGTACLINDMGIQSFKSRLHKFLLQCWLEMGPADCLVLFFFFCCVSCCEPLIGPWGIKRSKFFLYIWTTL